MSETTGAVEPAKGTHPARRIVAAIVIALSVLMLALSVAGIGGTWVARARLSSSILGVFTAVETRLDTVDQGLDRADAVLTEARDEVAAVQESVEALGADVEQNKPVVTVISNTMGAELAPLVNTTREVVRTAREAVVAVNSTVEALNAMPFVSVPAPELAVLNKLSDDLAALEATVQETRVAIDRRRSELVRGTMSVVIAPIAKIDRGLEGAQATVGQYVRQVAEVQARVAAAKSAISSGLTMTAVVITLVLLWAALSQVGLLVHGLYFFSNRDLLARWR
jgi:hypothetical protein